MSPKRRTTTTPNARATASDTKRGKTPKRASKTTGKGKKMTKGG